ncbi:unnamed protein product [Amoebophrya sp. A25]|nr:unnamed protein product [Amoebophrya sp. A25]|eukprot:GSA25T00006612001.1
MSATLAESQVHVFRKKLGKLAPYQPNSENAGQEVLFREFFGSGFSRTLSQVKDARKVEFAQELERNIDKFDPITQQPYLQCLSVFLLKGRDTPECNTKATECIQKVFDRIQLARDMTDDSEMLIMSEQVELKDCLPADSLSAKAIKEVSGQAFQQVWSVLPQGERRFLTEVILEKVYAVDIQLQRDLVQRLEPAKSFVEKEVNLATSQLNDWLKLAPKFPATPLVLGELFHMCLKSKNCPLYKAISDKTIRERFLISISLTINIVLANKTLSWAPVCNPILRKQAYDLQLKYFYHGGNIIMDKWLESRLQAFNKELNDHLVDKVVVENTYEPLLQILGHRCSSLPERLSDDDDSEGWQPLEMHLRALELTVLEFAERYLTDKWFCPHHVLTKDAVLRVFKHYKLLEVKEIAAGSSNSSSSSSSKNSELIRRGKPNQPPPPVSGVPAYLLELPPPRPLGGHPGAAGGYPFPPGHPMMYNGGPGGGPGGHPGHHPGGAGMYPPPPHHMAHQIKGGHPNHMQQGGPGVGGKQGGVIGMGPPPGVPGHPGGLPGGLPGQHPSQLHPAGGHHTSTNLPPHLLAATSSQHLPPGVVSKAPAMQQQITVRRWKTKEELKDMHCENLVDLLVKETFLPQLEAIDPNTGKPQIPDSALSLTKVESCEDTWTICQIEVTFRTENGKLFVYKSNAATRNVPVETWIDNDLASALVAKGLKPPKKGLQLAMGTTGIRTKIIAGPGEEAPPLEAPDPEAPNYDYKSGMYEKNGIVFSVSRPGEVPQAQERFGLPKALNEPGFIPETERPDRGAAVPDADANGANAAIDGAVRGPVESSDLQPVTATSILDQLDTTVFTEAMWEDQKLLGKLVHEIVKKKIADSEWRSYCTKFGFVTESQQEAKRHTVDTLKFFLQDQIKADLVSGEKDIVKICTDLLTSSTGAGGKEKRGGRKKAGVDDVEGKEKPRKRRKKDDDDGGKKSAKT